MQTEFKPVPLIDQPPCIMKGKLTNNIILVTKSSAAGDTSQYATILSSPEKHTVGNTYKMSGVNIDDYELLPAGTQVIITNQ